MGDEKSLSPELTLALEQRRVVCAFAEIIDEYEDDSEYAVEGYKALKTIMPEMTDELYRSWTGHYPPQDECTGYPSSCCGYCSDCETHHDDSDRDRVCNMGHCHDCKHVCEDS